ncbi:MAG: EI24 domain-containing protein [Bacteroidales bacterium]|nr:EI24 domain-containing protein [Bacteroidales bacterium]
MKESRSIFESAMAGVRSVMSAFAFIRQNGMMKAYVWIGIVMIVLFVGGMGATWKMHGVIDGLISDYGNSFLQNYSLPSWIGTAAGYVAAILVTLLALVLVFMLAGYVALILLSPVFSYLAQKTIRILTGHEAESSVKVLLWGIVRGIAISVRNMLMQLVVILLLFACSFIPVVGIVCPFLIFIVDAFFIGCCMADYSLEVKGLNVGESIRFERQNRALMSGLGFMYAMVMKIPIIGIYIVILIAPASVVGAAMELCDENRSSLELIDDKD